jgi:hypothetical protein
LKSSPKIIGFDRTLQETVEQIKLNNKYKSDQIWSALRERVIELCAQFLYNCWAKPDLNRFICDTSYMNKNMRIKVSSDSMNCN